MLPCARLTFMLALLLALCVLGSPLVDCHGDCHPHDGPDCATCIQGCTHAIIAGSVVEPPPAVARPLPAVHRQEPLPSRTLDGIFRPPQRLLLG